MSFSRQDIEAISSWFMSWAQARQALGEDRRDPTRVPAIDLATSMILRIAAEGYGLGLFPPGDWFEVAVGLLIDAVDDCATGGGFTNLVGEGVIAAIDRAVAVHGAARAEAMGGLVTAIVYEIIDRYAPADPEIACSEAIGILAADYLDLAAGLTKTFTLHI